MAVLHQMIKGAPRSVLLHNPRSKARYKTVICSLLERINSVSIKYRSTRQLAKHDDVIKWKHFPRYWPFVRGIHRSLVNPLHKGQWRGALMFSIICAWINRWVYNRTAGDLRRHRAHYDVIVMFQCCLGKKNTRWDLCRRNNPVLSRISLILRCGNPNVKLGQNYRYLKHHSITILKK